MHVDTFLHKTLASVMHLKRWETLKKMVYSALTHQRISVTGLGRGMEGSASERSHIRRSDRFIGNPALQGERKDIYRALCQWLLKAHARPWVIVDWSHLPNTSHYVLRAGLVTTGRALTLYEEVYPKEMENHPTAHKNFLQEFQQILPKGCQPILITDAGFHNPWFREVQKRGWDYIGRVRGKKCYRHVQDTSWQPCHALHSQATLQGIYVGQLALCRTSPLLTHAYLITSKKKGRVHLNKLGTRSYYKRDREHSRAANEPWFLVSSLPEATSHVCQGYAARMQIEESFRDLKSSSYGLGLEKAYTQNIARLGILLLIAMIASWVAWLTGVAAEKQGWQSKFQANSTKSRRVLSLFFLGCQIIKKKIKIPPPLFRYLLSHPCELPLGAS